MQKYIGKTKLILNSNVYWPRLQLLLTTYIVLIEFFYLSMRQTLTKVKIHLWCKSIVQTLHYCSLCTFKVPQGANNIILCTLDTIHRLFFVTRLIINKINKVQWVNFKMENVLVSLHSLKTIGLDTFGVSAPLFLRNGELLGHSPIHNTFLWRHTIVWTVDYF